MRDSQAYRSLHLHPAALRVCLSLAPWGAQSLPITNASNTHAAAARKMYCLVHSGNASGPERCADGDKAVRLNLHLGSQNLPIYRCLAWRPRGALWRQERRIETLCQGACISHTWATSKQPLDVLRCRHWIHSEVVHRPGFRIAATHSLHFKPEPYGSELRVRVYKRIYQDRAWRV